MTIGAGGGFTGNVVKQTVDIASGAQTGGFNFVELGIWTGAGGAAAGILRPFVGVMESSYGPIAQGLLTKYLNGTISGLTPAVAAKAVVARIGGENAIAETALGEYIKDSATEVVQDLLRGGRPAVEPELKAAPTQGSQNLNTFNPPPPPKSP